ncbi:MAG: excinuclease ABC subunit UvrA [Bacteroidaceae bacterium]|nr:excinuclease ABC subunit UvrA [Bacteroidaceae bacterium]
MQKDLKKPSCDSIILKGCRVNNLKNIDVEIPRGNMVVITGVSGSGKSSLAFDTLYAEGQRRYVESLSTYARQFMGRLSKPDCDFIEGIPPAIAIEQKVSSRNPRSTVGTTTEIYDYMRMLYARVGHTFSPVSGKEVKKHTPEDIVNCMQQYAEGTRFMVLAPLVCHNGRSEEEQLVVYAQEGLDKIEKIDGKTYVVIARIVVRYDNSTITRLLDACETAQYESDGKCVLKFNSGEGEGDNEGAGAPYQGSRQKHIYEFSFAFEADGIIFEEPTEQFFSFNSPAGACPECEGFGKVMGIDENLVIPNQELSVYDGAVMCWRGEKLGQWKEEFILRNGPKGFPIFTPYFQLSEKEKNWLWHGELTSKSTTTTTNFNDDNNINEWDVCIDLFFQMLKEKQYKIQNRVMLARYRGKTVCPKCHGRRLKKETEYVKVGGKSITELVEMPVDVLSDFFNTLKLPEHDAIIAKTLLVEIKSRLQFLKDVGLSYITLNRLSNTLSGGESQRINLTTSLGSTLMGSMYVLDEPSIGMHSRDTQRLIKVLGELRDAGNTVVVVEHDEEIMRAADYIIDIGPDAGRLGGEVVFASPVNKLNELKPTLHSHTLDYLTGTDSIPTPLTRRPWNNYILIKCARENNLKGIDVKIPLNVMTVVTGVSGSGKSTLVREIFFKGMKRHLDEVCDRPGQFLGLDGDVDMVERVEFVDQNPIGTSTRSNPVTYIGAWDEIRKLMASQQLAKQMGYSAQYFSFNTTGGRCEECKGEGYVKVDMQFMNDLVLECETCHGRRFKDDVLDVKFKDKNVFDILNMTINQAIEFFSEVADSEEPSKLCRKIVQTMKPLQDVGLGYVKLGQNSSTLSGGESQRVKLAYFISKDKLKSGATGGKASVFIFDEPTTGLHFHDIKKLLKAFDSLISHGHTVLVIEHNMEVIKCADHIIDLGPEGGIEGGYVVAEGRPEQIIKCKNSYTANVLKKYL